MTWPSARTVFQYPTPMSLWRQRVEEQILPSSVTAQRLISITSLTRRSKMYARSSSPSARWEDLGRLARDRDMSLKIVPVCLRRRFQQAGLLAAGAPGFTPFTYTPRENKPSDRNAAVHVATLPLRVFN